ncbi:hypothetical protein PInf_016461 [Phytophthora infestans]|nr:hypothetical protein PInf_016461 [Phytophthora infestans]
MLPYTKADKSTILNAAALQHDLLHWTCTLVREDPESEHKLRAVEAFQSLGIDASGFVRPARSRMLSDHVQLRPRLTLAQKRGLVTRPSPKLTLDEWENCEQQAQARGDMKHPCSICREPLGIKEQVILSCSHIFHVDCITSFERFLRTNQHVCPLCRKQDYQKRCTTISSAFHREHSAKRIQAVFRGFAVRRQVATLWQKFYSSGKGDSVRRRRFFANRVRRTTDRLVTAMSKRDDSVDVLLKEFDKSLRVSRHVFQDCFPETKTGLMLPEGDDWLATFKKANARDDRECAICINGFSSSMEGVLLLSCSHAFHSQCLSAFEDFSIYEVSLCPTV